MFCEKYFLGSNTNSGFYSLFDGLYDPEGDWHVWVLKGGPGCGKSTLMGEVARLAAERGRHVSRVMCASDPESFDAVIVRDCGIVMVDGTAPHVVEPKYYGACEEIVNLGEALDVPALIEHRDEVRKLCHLNSACYKKAINYQKAAASLYRNNKRLQDEYIDYEKLYNYVISFVKRELGLKNGTGRISYRFFTAVTNQGVIGFPMSEQIRTILIDDKIGAVSGQLLDCLLTVAEDCGISAVVGVSPFDTEELLQIFFPEQGFAVTRKGFGNPGRTIHAERFMLGDGLNKHKEKIRFNKKACSELTCAAITSLAEAKRYHDGLEKIYSSCMDYSMLSKKTAPVIANITSIIKKTSPKTVSNL